MTVISNKEDDAGDTDEIRVENKNEDAEAMDLCQVSTNTSQTILSAKMRLKKQRLDEVSHGREWNFVADGLQKLAEAAEIKQVGIEKSLQIQDGYRYIFVLPISFLLSPPFFTLHKISIIFCLICLPFLWT